MNYYQCPVCGYNKMTRPPENFYICPCCGTEFENDDFDETHDALRLKWIERGMNWFSRYTHQPNNWSPIGQLALAGKLGEQETDKLRRMGAFNKVEENPKTDEAAKRSL